MPEQTHSALPEPRVLASNGIARGHTAHLATAQADSSSALQRWYYSGLMLAVYLATFMFWRFFPSRTAFVCGGLVSGTALGLGMIWAGRRGYFASRVDYFLHAYVIVDLLLEGILYEALRLVVNLQHVSDGYVFKFHNNNNFVFCALAFVALVGGHRWHALRRRRKTGA